MNRENPTVGFMSGPYFPLAVYGTATVGGCIFIAFSKLSGVDTRLTISVPIILMLLYLALSIALGRLRVHDEQTGDNLYYMGFLFTLSSLGVSLYQFDSGMISDSEQIVRNFGVAVTSTITGIMLRILFNQMRRDPLEIERAARHELADVTRRVRTELEAVAREFADFRRVSNQMIEEGFGEIAAQAERNGENIRTSLEKMAEEGIHPVREASGKLTGVINENVSRIENEFSGIVRRVQSTAGLLEQANNAMSSSVSKLGDHADRIAGKLERLIVPDEILKNELAPMVKALGMAVTDYGTRAERVSKEQQEQIAGIVAALEKVAENSQKSQASAQEQQTRMAGIAAAMEKLTDTVDRVAAASEKSSDIVALQQQASEELARAVQKQGENTNELLSRLLDNLEQGQRLLASHLAAAPRPAEASAQPGPVHPAFGNGDASQPTTAKTADQEDPGERSWWWFR